MITDAVQMFTHFNLDDDRQAVATASSQAPASCSTRPSAPSQQNPLMLAAQGGRVSRDSVKSQSLWIDKGSS